MQVANIIAIRATISELSKKHKQGVDEGLGIQQLECNRIKVQTFKS